MQDSPIVWIVMGVAGVGKTTVGRALAAVRECDFLEGDRRHPLANIEKMQAQTPLTDGDRIQWLDALVADLQRALDCGYETVVTCSALKRSYRDRLRIDDLVQFIWIDLPSAELQRRLLERTNHYMTATMLEDQLATLEPLGADESPIMVSGMSDVATIVQTILTQGQSRFRAFDRPWWAR